MAELPDDALDVRFAELLSARLCHDMAGAVGAAAAGAELLEDGFDADTAKLVADCARGAVARLKFFRAAFGPAGGEQVAGMTRDLCAAFLAASAAAGGDLTLGWDCPRPRLDGETARLVLNLVLLARDGLPRGGRVDVAIDPAPPPGRAGVTVEFGGQGAGLDETAARCLGGGGMPDGPREAQAWLTRKLAEKVAGGVVVAGGENRGRISA